MEKLLSFSIKDINNRNSFCFGKQIDQLIKSRGGEDGESERERERVVLY